jgi:hypothetical protein
VPSNAHLTCPSCHSVFMDEALFALHRQSHIHFKVQPPQVRASSQVNTTMPSSPLAHFSTRVRFSGQSAEPSFSPLSGKHSWLTATLVLGANQRPLESSKKAITSVAARAPNPPAAEQVETTVAPSSNSLPRLRKSPCWQETLM